MKSSTYKKLWFISENVSYIATVLCALFWIAHVWTDAEFSAKFAWTSFIVALLGYFMWSWYKDEWKKAKKRERSV